MAFYLIGFIAALAVAKFMKYILKSKQRSFYVMELPTYKTPNWKTILYTTVEKVKIFLFDAGKIIIAVSIILWVLSSYGPSGKFEKIEQEMKILRDDINQIRLDNNEILRIVGRLEGKLSVHRVQ